MNKTSNRVKHLKNLYFLKNRHYLTGFDVDYLNILSDDELVFLEKFAREFYDGDTDDVFQKKLANRRRYLAKQADAMSVLGHASPATRELTAQPISVPQTTPADDLNPETLLLLAEQIK